MSGLLRMDDQGRRLFLGGDCGAPDLKHHLMRHVVRRALSHGHVEPGGVVGELSVGAAGLALARAARDAGLRARVYVPPSLGESALGVLRECGAEVVAGLPGGLSAALADLAERHARGELYWVRQNFTLEGRQAYRGLARSAPPPGTLVAAVGSGGSLQGFAETWRRSRPEMRIVAVFSPDIEGLRDVDACIDLGPRRDVGARRRLQQRYGKALTAVRVTRAELREAREDLRARSLACADSTVAVWHVMRALNLQDATGLSVNGRRHGVRNPAPELGSSVLIGC